MPIHFPRAIRVRVTHALKIARILVNQRNHKEGEHGNAAWNYK